MKRLILHVGTHKTGTTAIQHALFTDRDRLSIAGLLYDTKKPEGQRGPRSAHHWLAHALARFDEDDQAALEAFRNRMLSAAAGTILISAEPFYRHVDLSSGENPRDRVQFPAARQSYLDRVARFFEPFKTEVSIYFRRPDRYIESLYKENSASNQLSLDFEGYRASSPPCFLLQYQARLDELRQRFGNVTVHCFEDACKKGLIDSFYADHGLPARPAGSPPEPRRGSVSLRAALWLVEVKRTQELSQRDRNRRWSFAISDAGASFFQSDQKEMFWKDDAERQEFVMRSVEGFAHASFWTLRPEKACAVQWTATDQARADLAFEAWLDQNLTWMEAREAHGLLPYMLDMDMPQRAGVRQLLSRIFGR